MALTGTSYGGMPSLVSASTTVMSRFAVKANPNPKDPTAVTLAFGDRQMPKLRQQLADELLIVRQRAVVSLCALLVEPDNIVQAVHADVVAGLRALLADADPLIREKSCAALALIAGSFHAPLCAALAVAPSHAARPCFLVFFVSHVALLRARAHARRARAG